jgi:serine phosphatase RsbU (regulator of sigma subunit)
LPNAHPAYALDQTNRLLLKTSPFDGRFVTACLVVIDLSDGTARVANAGYPAPLLVVESPRALELANGVPLGTFVCRYDEH